MEPVSRSCRLSLAMNDGEMFHFAAVAIQVMPLFRSARIRFLISVGIGCMATPRIKNQQNYRQE